METRKYPKAEVHRWTQAFFNLGLALSVGAVLVAFEWKSYEVKLPLEFENGNLNLDDFQVPITIQEPPKLPDPVQMPKFESVDDEVEIEDKFVIDVNLSSDEVIPVVELDSTPPIIDEGDEIYDYTEVQASFKGGMEGWYAYLKKNLKYPKMEQRAGLEGTVFLRFVINTDGSIENVEVVRSASPGLDAAAKEVVENSPQWEPGRFRGRPVRSRMTIPIKFKLN